ncbi:hypothetical protein Q7A53_05255 [Halobacillus rhizosphaerae]|uniref:hypothetical protein n=1 Tax=Halobacillus rhizosphaerae TaxID=3064889 RepID=UPI00398B938E
MNEKQLEDLRNIKKLAETILPKTPVQKDIVSMIVELVKSIQYEEIEKRCNNE